MRLCLGQPKSLQVPETKEDLHYTGVLWDVVNMGSEAFMEKMRHK